MSLFQYCDRVRPEWVDFNGHMQDAYYALVFSEAVGGLMDDIGVDDAYRTSTKGTIYTIEGHIWWVQESHEGAPLLVESRLLDIDAKRLHVWQECRQAETGERLACMETMQIHVSQAGETPKSAPFPPDVMNVIEDRYAKHQAMEPPEPRAAAMGIRRR